MPSYCLVKAQARTSPLDGHTLKQTFLTLHLPAADCLYPRSGELLNLECLTTRDSLKVVTILIRTLISFDSFLHCSIVWTVQVSMVCTSTFYIVMWNVLDSRLHIIDNTGHPWSVMKLWFEMATAQTCSYSAEEITHCSATATSFHSSKSYDISLHMWLLFLHSPTSRPPPPWTPAHPPSGKAKYIMQVKALEKELIKRVEEQGLDIEPQIIVVTRCLPFLHKNLLYEFMIPYEYC